METNFGQKDTRFWHYIRNGEQIGPVSEPEMLYLFREGFLNGDTFVWTKNMERWEKARKFPEFTEVIIVPPPIPISPLTSETIDFGKARPITGDNAGPKARPWIRYLARSIDMTIFGILFAIVLSIMSPDFLEKGPGFVFSFLSMLIWVFIEPLILTIFGNTFGKALLKTRIGMADGSKITYETALKRSFSLWIKGMGLGIPIVTIICNAVSLGFVNDNKVAKWDKEFGFVVTHGEIGILRIFLAIAAVIGIFIFGAIFIGIFSYVSI